MSATDDSTFEEIEAEELISKLTKKTDIAYSLNRTVVKGQLNLKNRVIERPINIQGCKFQDEVNLRYCEFKQTVNLSGCTFVEKFDSGDEDEAYTIYRKDLICKGVVFKKDACFVGARVEGDAHFSKATFEDKKRKTIFKGKADFGTFKCDGYGYFEKARFKKEVHLEHASFGRSLECNEVVFKGKASFHAVRCGISAFFKNARFKSVQGVDFDYASFDSTLQCDGAKFRGTANFESIKCGRKASFDNAEFLSENGKEPSDYSVTFVGASFGKQLSCKEAVFKGPVTFNGVRCDGYAFFNDAQFESEKQPLTEKRPPTDKEQPSKGYSVTFNGLSVGEQLVCRKAEFEGPVSFNGVRCDGTAFFDGTRFLSGSSDTPNGFSVDFTTASFGGQLICNDVVFKGPASFNGVKCNSIAVFQNAQFESGEQNFRFASFEMDLRFNGATFKGEKIDLRYFRTSANLNLEHAFFDANVNLSHAHISKKLCLGGSCFRKQVDLYGTEITVLELLDVDHNYPIEVRATERQEGMESVVETSEELKRIFNDKQYKEELKSVVDELYPFKGTSLNLSNTTFKRFHGGRYPRLQERLALKLAEGQDPKKFNRDPYMQLEEFYRSEGNDAAAKKMYYKGRCAYRENANRKDGSAKWSKKAWFWDGLWKWLTGYGVGYWPLFGISLSFIIAGMLLFSLVPNSLESTSEPSPQPGETATPKSSGEATKASMPSEEAAMLLTSASETSAPKTAPDGEQDPSVEGQDPKGKQDQKSGGAPVFDRVTYSLDQFIPLVNLHVDERWVPSRPWLHTYVVVHTIVGWLVVPLLIAALAGVMKRE